MEISTNQSFRKKKSFIILGSILLLSVILIRFNVIAAVYEGIGSNEEDIDSDFMSVSEFEEFLLNAFDCEFGVVNHFSYLGGHDEYQVVTRDDTYMLTFDACEQMLYIEACNSDAGPVCLIDCCTNTIISGNVPDSLCYRSSGKEYDKKESFHYTTNDPIGVLMETVAAFSDIWSQRYIIDHGNLVWLFTKNQGSNWTCFHLSYDPALEYFELDYYDGSSYHYSNHVLCSFTKNDVKRSVNDGYNYPYYALGYIPYIFDSSMNFEYLANEWVDKDMCYRGDSISVAAEDILSLYQNWDGNNIEGADVEESKGDDLFQREISCYGTIYFENGPRGMFSLMTQNDKGNIYLKDKPIFSDDAIESSNFVKANNIYDLAQRDERILDYFVNSDFNNYTDAFEAYEVGIETGNWGNDIVNLTMDYVIEVLSYLHESIIVNYIDEMGNYVVRTYDSNQNTILQWSINSQTWEYTYENVTNGQSSSGNFSDCIEEYQSRSEAPEFTGNINESQTFESVGLQNNYKTGFLYLDFETADINGNGVLDYSFDIRDAGDLTMENISKEIYASGQNVYGASLTIWNSPYGLCAYRIINNSESTLEGSYILDEVEITNLVNQYNIDLNIIPHNDCEN